MSILFTHFFTKFNEITPLERDFTEVLDHIAVKPKMLYFYGKMPQNVSKLPKNSPQKSTKTAQNSPLFRPKTVAIVGSRHNTRYGQEVAYQMAYELAKRGVVIASGLAYGIDSIGHQAALDAKGITVAVLGNSIDHIHPSSHTKLAEEIIESGGAVMSEYAPNTPDYKDAPLAPGEFIDERGRRQINYKASFLYRNRLIAALSDIVVVVEAAERSGSLNTATHALNQGKDVFAVPGNITSPYSQGCNKLITQGAQPYTCPDDLLRILFPEDFVAKHKKLKQLDLFGDTDVETLILQALHQGLRSGEAIMEATHLPPEVFNQSATLLEIKGRISSLGANHWSLN